MKHFTPQTISELFTALKEMTPQSKFISGGTDLLIRLNQGTCTPDALVYLGHIPQMHEILSTAEGLEIGCMVTMTQLAESELLVGPWAAIKHAAEDVGARQIRNSATVGGNLGNLSPAGDLMPVWFLLDARVEVMQPDGKTRRMSVQDVFLGPGKSSLAYNEVMTRFFVPHPTSSTQKSAFVKLGSRKTLTISRVGLAASIDFDDSAEVSSFQLTVGAISPTPVSVEKAETYLIGKKLCPTTVEQIGQFLSELIMEITPEHFDRDYKAAAAFGVTEDLLKKLMP